MSENRFFQGCWTTFSLTQGAVLSNMFRGRFAGGSAPFSYCEENGVR